MRTDSGLVALEQALWSRSVTEGLVQHGYRGSRYLSIRYTGRRAVVESSVACVGDSYDSALAETIIALFKSVEGRTDESPVSGLSLLSAGQVQRCADIAETAQPWRVITH